MPKVDFIRARVEPETKHDAEIIFKKLGLSISEAITLFYSQVILNRGLPFEVKIPNEETLRVFLETDRGENLTEYENPDAFFKKMSKNKKTKKPK